jgi:hypothetical protein
MRSSSSVVAPFGVAVLSMVLLCGPAASQTATGPAAVLPSVTVDAPKHVAKPRRLAHAAASRQTSAAGRVSSATGQASTARTPAPGSVLGRIASLEKVASNCNGGCESSMPHGKDPWVGCSESGGGQAFGPYSATCRDSLTYKSYEDCLETKVFLGEYRNRATWICSSLSAGNKFQVAELKRPRHPR